VDVSPASPAPAPLSPIPRRASPRYLGALLALGIAYFAFGRIGLLFAYPNPSISTIWPDTGIAIATLLLLGLDLWPAVFVGAFLTNVATTGSIESSLLIASGNSLEAILGASLVVRFARGTRAFEHPDSVLGYVLLAGFLAPVLSATTGVLSLTLLGESARSAFPAAWGAWWLGDAVGAITMGSLLLIVAGRQWVVDAPGPNGRTALRRGTDILLIGTVETILAIIIFWLPTGTPGAPYFRVALLIPVVIWAAFRFGPLGAALSNIGVTLISLGATVHGAGPFATAPLGPGLQTLRIFLGALAIAALLVGAERFQRDRNERALEETRRTLEERVAERTATLHAAQALAHLGNWELDLETGRVLWSEEMYRIYGYGDERFPVDLARAYERVPPAEVSEITQNLRRIATRPGGAEVTVSSRFHLVLPNGETRTVEARGAVAATRGGRPTRLVGTVQDVTERDRLIDSLEAREMELLRSNRDLEQFAYVASHDLQEPLGVIEGYTRLLEERYRRDLDADGVEFLRHTRQAAVRMRSLIDDLLDFSRATEATTARSPVPLESVLGRACETLRVPIEESRATILRLGPLPEVEGNSTQLLRLFQNLLSNAIKFRDTDPPRIEVAARREGNLWTLSVTDRGIGIAPEYHARVFDVFQRLHTREEYPGTGIGLAICRRVVEAHGGRIWVESDGVPGHGTTVKFTLPAGRVAPPPAGVLPAIPERASATP
jgi:signal transduction histidine kinase